MTRDMRPGASSTLAKADRARRIALGLRRRSYARPKGLPRHAVLPPARRHLPTQPHLVRVPTMATFTDRDTGRRVRAPYLLAQDRSRYSGEKLRELRRTRR